MLCHRISAFRHFALASGGLAALAFALPAHAEDGAATDAATAAETVADEGSSISRR